MTNFIPIFPLGIVVYPGERLNLHIFEPRYKQLIAECYETKRPFGIPTVINNELQDFGTLVQISELSKLYEGGEMDIKTEGQRIFRILEVIQQVPDKLYSGAIVNYPVTYEDANPETIRRLVAGVRELHRMLKVTKDFKKEDSELRSYDMAHHVGLTLEEEYRLLNFLDERQRLEFLKQHITRVVPLISEMEKLKEKIKMNGHFRNIEGFNLK
ncbi:peptidase S16 [Flaviaesturariibacter flavus]|uniref:Peptidase S16 n=1 Tax=Flaviaesturariibacter flavus TaxID=2502780 RepID=A0A4R1B7N2_9BACT|nr:LON peptidase substrate-binding domain-containing protein [Flaviaesturariibacter flavus]TCJ13097.1 peptidase S16 [Flaviaesturariibacter flavus]TCJ17005.1 peptidase S16 [Flaviaesturariibacter flavus]